MEQHIAQTALIGTDSRPDFYTASEAAGLFRLDESTLYRHLRAGKFPGLKIGGRYVVPREVIERLVADVLLTGQCVELSQWTCNWRNGLDVGVRSTGDA